jgi:diaminohydroxyphosphoribosylaminopyrimidine deaminase/5-amino-6-(5-phosphoribosylamino)uracil reductase
VTSLLLEGGGGLAASFLAADRVDEVVLHQAPDFYGADGVAACAPLPVARRGVLPLGRFERHALRPLGRDVEIVFRRLSQ